MTVPLCARSVAAVIGGLLVPAAWSRPRGAARSRR